MGSAGNFYAAIANMHDEMEKRVVNKTRLLLEEILSAEKQVLLDQIQILVDRECTNQSSSFQWQVENNIMQFQCHSCSKTFPVNENEISHSKSEFVPSEDDSVSEDFTKDPVIEFEPENAADILNEDFEPHKELPLNVCDPVIEIVIGSDEEQMAMETPTTLSPRLESLNPPDGRTTKIIKEKGPTSKVQPETKGGGRDFCSGFMCPYVNCKLTKNQFPIMMKHIFKHHVGEKLACITCDNAIRNGNKTSVHMKHHMKKKNGLCRHCHKKMSKNTKKHSTVCNPVSDPNGTHQCEACQQKFIRISTLQRHKKVCSPKPLENKDKPRKKKFKRKNETKRFKSISADSKSSRMQYQSFVRRCTM